MSNESTYEPEISSNLDDESDEGDNEQQQISRIEDTNQQVTVPAITESFQNPIAISNLPLPPGAPVPVIVGKI